MSDGEQKTAEATETKEVTPTAPTFNWSDNDGKLVDGWRNRLDESIRGEKCLDGLYDVPTMVKNYVNAQKAIGKKGVPLPTDKSTPEEWNTFYSAIGRPKDAKEYVFDKAPDLPDEAWDSDAAEAFKQKAFELGLTTKQVAAIAEIENQRTAASVKLVQEAKGKEEETKAAEVAKQKDEAEKALKKEWGADYDHNLAFANAFVAKTTDESNKQDVLDVIGNNPKLIKWCCSWGKKTSESKSIDTSQFQKASPASLGDKIDQLRSTPGYMNGQLKSSDPIKHREIHAEITKLYNDMNPEP
jgi:hypothetical protein